MGVAGAIVGFVSIAKRWPVPRTWLALLAVYAVDITSLVVMFV